MNIAYHESRHRYYTETRGGTIGEVNAILMQSSQESWYLATDDYIRSMASYAEVSLQKSLNLSLSKQQIVDYPQFRNLTNSLRALRSKPPRMRFLLFKLAFCHVLTDMIV